MHVLPAGGVRGIEMEPETDTVSRAGVIRHFSFTSNYIMDVSVVLRCLLYVDQVMPGVDLGSSIRAGGLNVYGCASCMTSSDNDDYPLDGGKGMRKSSTILHGFILDGLQ